jgi:hypothetical protein
LTRAHPELAPRYRELFGNGSYAPAAYRQEITARVRMAARRHGLHRAEAAQVRALDDADQPAAVQVVDQLTLI